ncbi:hypothetical protein AAFN85_31210 [Mucilaginibacter sp. CAU 1740]|uniref:hypothetical protein n=1 Tax=Mucilaginibacter sp. CAU 1740 TaxID=3140365 RepID=UPI00325B6686
MSEDKATSNAVWNKPNALNLIELSLHLSRIMVNPVIMIISSYLGTNSRPIIFFKRAMFKKLLHLVAKPQRKTEIDQIKKMISDNNTSIQHIHNKLLGLK